MYFNELFENELVVEIGSTHRSTGRGEGAFSRGAYQQMATWLSGLEDHDVRMFIANLAADIYENDNSGFKKELFLRKVSEGETYAANFRWQQRHYWSFANAIKALPNQNMKDFIGIWLGDQFERQRNRSIEWRGFRRNLWDSACGIDGSDPEIAENPYLKKYRD